MKAAVKILAAQQASSMKAVPGKSPKKSHGCSKPSKQLKVVKKTIQKRTFGCIFSMVNVKCEVHGADCHHEFESEQLFDIQDVIVAVTCCILRKIKCYPKTSIEVPGESDPKGFRSVLQTYAWAHRYLRRLANQFGTEAVAVKLQQINWFVTTCFSGVGCAETVHYLLLGCLNQEDFAQ